MAIPETSPNSDTARAQLAARLTGLVLGRLKLKKLPGNDQHRGLTKLLADVAERAGKEWSLGGRQFLNWCRCEPVPPDGKLGPVLDFCFPTDGPERATIEDLHRRALEEQEEARPPRGATRSPARMITSRGEDELPTASDWIEDPSDLLQPGLAELRVFAPPRHRINNPDLAPVEIALDIRECPDEVGNVPVRLALKDAVLHAEPVDCTANRDSRAGEADNPRDDVAVKGGVWPISAPVNQAGHLDGYLFADKPLLMHVLLQGTGQESVTLRLTSQKRSLVVIPEDGALDGSVLKERLLENLLQKSLSNGGQIQWARATLRRKPDLGGGRR